MPSICPSLLPSIIRVSVPIIVGCLVSLAIFHAVDRSALTELVTALIIIVYYSVVRAAEHYISASFSWLLGHKSTPMYVCGTSDDDVDDA